MTTPAPPRMTAERLKALRLLAEELRDFLPLHFAPDDHDALTIRDRNGASFWSCVPPRCAVDDAMLAFLNEAPALIDACHDADAYVENLAYDHDLVARALRLCSVYIGDAAARGQLAAGLIQDVVNQAAVTVDPDLLIQQTELLAMSKDMRVLPRGVRWLARVMLETCTDLTTGAPNAVQIDVSGRDGCAYHLTVQKAEGKSPLALKAEADARYERLRSAVMGFVERELAAEWRIPESERIALLDAALRDPADAAAPRVEAAT